MSFSLTTIGAVAAESEATEGTRPNQTFPGTRAFNVVNSPSPMDYSLTFNTFDVNRSDFATIPDVPSIFKQLPRFTTPFQGGSAAGTPPRFSALLKCAGLAETINTASVVYTLATDPTDWASATVVTETGGRAATHKITRESNGVWGTIQITGTPREGWLLVFDGQGRYLAEVLTPATTAGWTAFATGTSGYGNPLLSGANRIAINSGGSDYYPVVANINFSTNVRLQDIEDLNAGATQGLAGILASGMDPRLTITFAQDPDPSANVTDLEFYTDIAASTDQTIDWAWTDAASRTLTWACSGQPVNRNETTSGQLKQVTQQYKLHGTSALTITQT